ncbi:MAG: NfeD family protein [Pirellulales bacterium]
MAAASFLWLAGGGVHLPPVWRVAADEPPAASAPPAAEAPAALWIPVPLPIQGNVDTNVMRLIDRGLARVPATGQRTLLVLEFIPPGTGPLAPAADGPADQPAASEPDRASQFERSLALARYLTSDRLRQVRTLAFLPRSVTGHAVLSVLACEEIVAAPDAELGDAGAAEAVIDPAVRHGYEEIAERRRTIPLPVVQGLLDRQLAVYQVRTPQDSRFVLQEELETLRAAGQVAELETVKQAGEPGRFTGRDLRRKYGFATHEATDRASLAAALRIPVQQLEPDPSLADGWLPVRVDLRGPLTDRQLNWVRRRLADRLRAGNCNLVWIWIDSPGGMLTESLGLAAFLAEIPPDVRTVAFVPSEARGDAALIALACDQLVVGERAVLGGPGAEAEDIQALDGIRGSLEQIARRQDRPWSWLAALIDSRVELSVYTHRGTGQRRWLCQAEWETLENREAWERGAVLPVGAGLTGRQALDCELARFEAGTFEELRALYHWEGEVEVIEPNWAHRLIESLASPQLAALLLFLACFALIVELMTPNLTGAGIVSVVCFVLFFWSQFLHGTAGWLEVLLFLIGVACLAVEVFLIPGFGVFGFSGGLLVLTSLILASQTFIVPRNAYQVSQLPASLWTVVAAGCGVLAAMALLRRLLPRAPFFRRVMLEPPVAEELDELRRREAVVDWSHLLGQRGVSATRLVPSGKAQFGDDLVDVLSDGELVERGTPIEVVEVLGNRVVVRACE